MRQHIMAVVTLEEEAVHLLVDRKQKDRKPLGQDITPVTYFLQVGSTS
jgi:hypothetical protein